MQIIMIYSQVHHALKITQVAFLKMTHRHAMEEYKSGHSKGLYLYREGRFMPASLADIQTLYKFM